MGVYGTKVCEKIIVLFIAMLAGYIAKKTKLVDGHSTKALSALLASITNPALIFASLQADFEPSILKMMLGVLVMSAIIHGVMVFAGSALTKPLKLPDERSVYAFGLIYMNCGFMGYPIMQAMFPDYGLLYGVIYTIPFNVFVWTHGVALMGKAKGVKPDIKKILLNPGIISTVISTVFFVTNLRFPKILVDGASMVGDMTFPLSMMITGSLLADIKLRSLVTDKKLVGYSAIKMLIIPLAMLGVCLIFKAQMGFTLAAVCITMCAAPTASLTAVLAEVHENNSALAAKLVGLTTLFSLVTMPAMLILAEKLL